MKIEMTETTMGSLDGETVQELIKGHQYDTVETPRGDRLAQYHLDQGVAIMASPEAPEAAPEPVIAPAKARK
jgi:hypothetical protein